MATFDDVAKGSSANVGEILANLSIDSLSTLARGLIIELISPNIDNFNTMNYDFMNIHMMRNRYEKEITLNSVGESAYKDGNPESTIAPGPYSYTRGNNYVEFVTNVHDASKSGELTTRIEVNDSEMKNLYLDMDGDYGVNFTGNASDRNSILYKTKKLIKLNKLKTIVSQFHTDASVKYVGQIGSNFGESHGRNLLTKDAETGGSGYNINGYDNPYCRVWTHHHKYDKISKTMRSNSGGLNRWNNFEWNQNDKGHGEDNTTYGDGERYDYAWRGKHNQDRREANSVLDTKTGLVKITPQFRGGGSNNRHTKECMFSIENLAWKDYDPFSFEEALSWEQRGPFGGRIMWFPPYGLEITETASAKWNSNDFIGRGEPVYTYVNSERSGNLSFLMLTDHPSSIDYASWWDDNNMVKNTTDSSGNCENDYLRYFAGCSNSTNDGSNEGAKNMESSNTGLIINPTPLTDEYPKDNPPLIELKKKEPKPQPPKQIPVADKTPKTVEFFVFYPNNYSGVHDYPTVGESIVDSIIYLLAGRNAEKNGNENDRTLHAYSYFSTTNGENIGYEMGRGPITTSDCDNRKQYIQGGVYGKNKYIVDKDKKWCYRIDHNQPYNANNKKLDNFICENLKNKTNYSDTNDFKINLDVSSNEKVQDMAKDKSSLYSLAEVAAAMYSDKMLDFPNIYNYLIEIGVKQTRVNELIELFTSNDWLLNEITCNGIASSHGYPENNEVLSRNRANTVVNWLHTYEKWRGIEPKNPGNKTEKVDEVDRTNVSGESSKRFRCAHCILTFNSSKTVQTNEPNEPVEDENKYIGFKYIESVPQADGSVWDYYEKDGSVTYYEQEGGSADNYEEAGKNDITVIEQQILGIFNTEGFKPFRASTVRANSKYRGLYNEFGVYITTFDYSKEDDPNIQEFINGMVCYKDSYIFHQRRFYKTKENYYDGIWDETYFNDITDIMATYAKGDIVLYDDDFYTCKEDFSKQHQDYTFDDDDWEEVTTANINEAIRAPYRFVEHKPSTGYEEKDIIYDYNIETEVGQFLICDERYYIQSPEFDVNNWEQLLVYCYEDSQPGDVWNEGDYVTYDDKLYSCLHDDTPYTGEFNEDEWEIVEFVNFSDLEDEYLTGCVVIYKDGYYKALRDIKRYKWFKDISRAIPKLVGKEIGGVRVFDGNYMYGVGDYCSRVIRTSGTGFLRYYKCLVDFSEKEFTKISFSNVDWEPTKDEDLYMYEFDWELANLAVKAAGVLCWTEDKMFSTITKGAPYAAIETNDKYSCIWKYGTTNNLNVDTSTNLTSYANLKETTSLNYDDENVEFRFTQDEEKYLETMYNENNADKPNIEINELRSYIILYRVLDNITKIENASGKRNVCNEAVLNDAVMNEKTIRKDESETDNCNDKRWVDRGDGLLIQACNIKEFNDLSDMRGRIVNGVAEGELNKLRYDQEYHFYKQWIADHPLMFEKLQEKIKYFNPAFHSMTPEGFNARCTFLQQCTRQGNTKTMSDQGGKTANNLAFGRPPYCVLRLGDFYYQMIVIDNISFDYNVDNGIQWDLNTEGNGVQPMLCKVNISFKFIGGGDITGPVQRLQNAMSFNYYANASFYDNRADRVQYQPTNWKTMGGAGNNEVDIEKSYAYIAKRYEEGAPNIVKPVQ